MFLIASELYPLPPPPHKHTPVPGEIVHLLETINTSPVDATKIELWTARDPVLSQVLQFVLQGWPSEVEEKKPWSPIFLEENN